MTTQPGQARSYGLYVAHRSGGHVDLQPSTRFADREEAVRAARIYQASRGPARQQSLGPVSVKAYPGQAATTTLAQWQQDRSTEAPLSAPGPGPRRAAPRAPQ